MSLFMIVGLVLAIILITASLYMAYTETVSMDRGIMVWEVAHRFFANIPKILSLMSSLMILTVSVVLSVFIAQSLYVRMVEFNMSDISEGMLIAAQVAATIAGFLAPQYLMSMWDTSLTRDNFVEAEANKINFNKIGIPILAVTTLIVFSLVGSSIAGYVSTAFMVTVSFFVFMIGLSILAILYCYIKRGATTEEVFAFAITIGFATLVYGIDFHWNELLAYTLPLQSLSPDLSDEEFAKAVFKFENDLLNRSVMTLILLMLDFLASTIELMTGGLKSLSQAMRIATMVSFNQEVNNINRRSGTGSGSGNNSNRNNNSSGSSSGNNAGNSTDPTTGITP